MTGGYGEHVAAVGFAGLKVQELENDLTEAELKHAEILAAVVTATGLDPVSVPARSALEFTGLLVDRINDCVRLCEQIKRDLNEYGQAWMGPGR